MDNNFNFSALLRMQGHENKHKIKPSQFVSVDGGIKRRLESNVKNRQLTRLSVFDNFRNLPNCESPAPVVLNKVEQRKLQLQKWKEEKERKKKETMAKRKIPFIIGVPKLPLNYEPPPPVIKPIPSKSGRVTRSQTVKTNKCVKKSGSNKEEKILSQSFAPKNAMFKPNLKDLNKPTLNQIIEEDMSNTGNNGPKEMQRTLRSRGKIHNAEVKNKQTKPIHSDMNSPPNDIMEKYKVESGKQNITNNLTKSKSKKNAIIDSMPSTSNVGTYLEHKLTKSKNVKKSKQLRKNLSNSNKISKIISIDDSSPDVLLMDADISTETPTRKSNRRKKSIDNTKEINISVGDFITFTPAKPVPKSESSSEERLRSPKVVDMARTPQEMEVEIRQISPRVCISRGKDKARNEMKKRINEGLLDDDVCDMTVEHFRRQLDSETKRITQMCDEWFQISDQLTLPETIQEAVLAAVGQARLLMSQKMQQFATLLGRCERPEPGTTLVTHQDLQGFWDMLFMQVVNIDLRFKKLEQCRDRGWVEEQPVCKARRAPKPAARAARPAATSRLKDLIAAARKAKKEQQSAVEVQGPPETEIKTFEAGFFSVKSPVKSVVVSTPVSSKPSLLKAVLSSEAKKASSRKSSFAMLRASSISKNIDKDETSWCPDNHISLTPVNLAITPGRSILKANNNSCKTEPKKSVKVLFNDTITSSETNENCIESDISGVETLRDSSFVEVKRKEGKENRRSRRIDLLLHEALDEDAMIMTRSRRRSIKTPGSENVRKPNTRNTVHVIDIEVTQTTPVRSRRRRNKLSENV